MTFDSAGNPQLQSCDPLAMIYLMHDDRTSELDLTGLSTEELKRAERYRIPGKRRQFLFTRSAGRQVLSQHFKVASGEIEWSASGPPEVSICETHLHGSFSCSHSDCLSALAIGKRDLSIGIDLECPDATLRPETIAAIALTEFEREELAQVPEDLRSQFLLRSWTIKEAILKSLRLKTVPGPQSLQLHWSQDDPGQMKSLGGGADFGDNLFLSLAPTMDRDDRENDEVGERRISPDSQSSAITPESLSRESISPQERLSQSKLSELTWRTGDEAHVSIDGAAKRAEKELKVGWRGGLAKMDHADRLGCSTGMLAIALWDVSGGSERTNSSECRLIPELKISRIRAAAVDFPGNASFLRDVFAITIKIPRK